MATMWKLLTFCYLTLPKLVNSQPPSSDKYAPRTLEERPWTNTHRIGAKNNQSLITMERRVPPDFMRLTIRDFMTNCDGQCFYHLGAPPNASSNGTSDPICQPSELRNCGLVASIAKHGRNQCPYFGKSSGSLKNTLCGESTPPKQIYTISLMRDVKEYSCPRLYLTQLQMACIPKEFVAISFYHEPGPEEINDDDKWYVCIAGEHKVTYWENVKNNATQIRDTNPHENSAPGVVSSKIEYNPTEKTLVCQFIISTEHMDPNVTFPHEAVKSTDPVIKVKMAKGRVLRSLLRQAKVPQTLFKKEDDELFGEFQLTEDEVEQEKNYFKYQQELIRPEFKDDVPSDEFFFASDFEGPLPDKKKIDFDALDIKEIEMHKMNSRTEDAKYNDEITKLIRRCDSPDEKGRFICFHPNDQKSCIFRQRCNVLVMVEEVKYKGEKVLQFYLISFRHIDKTSKKVLRPLGYAAVGFSRDTRMGGDLVISCLFGGPNNMDILVSWNEQHSNEYKPKLNEDLIFDKSALKYVLNSQSQKFFCSWKMKWKSVVTLNGYKIVKGAGGEPGDPPVRVIFDLEKDPVTFVMLATGATVYSSGRIAYHDSRQTNRLTFPASKIKGNNCPIIISSPNIVIALLCIVLIIVT